MFFRSKSKDSKQDLEKRNSINGLKAANALGKYDLSVSQRKANAKEIKRLRQQLS